MKQLCMQKTFDTLDSCDNCLEMLLLTLQDHPGFF